MLFVLNRTCRSLIKLICYSVRWSIYVKCMLSLIRHFINSFLLHLQEAGKNPLRNSRKGLNVYDGIKCEWKNDVACFAVMIFLRWHTCSSLALLSETYRFHVTFLTRTVFFIASNVMFAHVQCTVMSIMQYSAVSFLGTLHYCTKHIKQ